MNQTHRFPADPSKIGEIISWVMEKVRTYRFSNSEEQQINIALEEVVVNIVWYAYPQEKGDLCITCSSSSPKAGITLVFQDWGIPFDPVKYYEDVHAELCTKDLENTNVGGVGILLILGIMDDVQYRREEGCNILALTKYRD